MLFYKVTDKELLRIRNTIFLNSVFPVLREKGFIKSPFSTACFGWHPSMLYEYELCRLNDKHLEIITTNIFKGERWIQMKLNVFELSPVLSLSDLEGLSGIKFNLPPNNLTSERLDIGMIKGMPLFNYRFMFGGYRIKKFYSPKGLNRRMNQLEKRIIKDATHIDSIIRKWHTFHTPNVTDWEGNIISD